jgi:hypothetical protein
MQSTNRDFINFAVDDGGTRHFEVPIRCRLNTLVLVRNPLLISILMLLLLLPDIWTRLTHLGAKNIPLCSTYQPDFINKNCNIIPIWLYIAAFVALIFFLFFLLISLVRAISLWRLSGPHLMVTRHSFWFDELSAPLEFENIINIERFIINSKLSGLIFQVKSPVSLTASRTFWMRRGPQFSFTWMNGGLDDPKGVTNAIFFLFEQHSRSERVVS